MAKIINILGCLILIQTSLLQVSSLQLQQNDQEKLENIVFSTYFGGSNYEIAMDATLDNEGNIVITGCSRSSDFPILNANNSAFIPRSSYQCNLFLSKFSPGGDLIFSTFHGLGDEDSDSKITVDANNDIIMRGIDS